MKSFLTQFCPPQSIAESRSYATTEHETFSFNPTAQPSEADVRRSLVVHHLDSYNDAVFRGIPGIVDKEPPIEVKNYSVKFGQVTYLLPRHDVTGTAVYPWQARRRDLTYAAHVRCDVTVVDPHGRVTERPAVELCRLPVMLRSGICRLTTDAWSPLARRGECPLDPGGYFIIKGKERVLVPHIRPAYDRPTIYPMTEPGIAGPTNGGLPAWWICELRSVSPVSGQSVLTQVKTDGRLTLEFSLPYVKRFVPAGVVFKALTLTLYQSIEACGLGYVEQNGSIVCVTPVHAALIDVLTRQYNACPTDALTELGEYVPFGENHQSDRTAYASAVLSREVFVHLGPPSPFKTAAHLGWMVKKLAAVAAGETAPTDKDDLAHKRVDSAGNLLMFLFAGLFKQYVRLFRNAVETQKNPCPTALLGNTSVITNGLNLCFATGNWTVKRTGPPAYVRVGVSQVLCGHNYGARLSHLRRLTHAVGFKGKNFKIRQLHASHYGFICPYETPEGERVGVVLNLALSAGFSREIPREQLLHWLNGLPGYVTDLSCVRFQAARHFFTREDDGSYAAVTIDGRLVGGTVSPAKFVRQARRRLPFSVGVVWTAQENEIHILGAEGRFVRGVYDFCGLRGRPGTHALCAAELGVSRIAPYSDVDRTTSKSFDYAELPPARTLTDLMAAVIPFYDHTQSPRNAYQSNMGKQAIGIPSLALRDRYDATLHVLDYPQKALTAAEAVGRYRFDEMCHGAVPIIAVCTMNGFNQEDSVILNASSIERGLFTCATYRTLVEQDKKRSKHDSERVCMPDYDIRNRDWDYGLLDEHGVVSAKLARSYGAKYTVRPHGPKGPDRKYSGGVDDGSRTGGGGTGGVAALCDAVWLPAGTVLVGKVARRQTVPGGPVAIRDVSLAVRVNEEGYLDAVVIETDAESRRLVKIRLRTPRIPETGDKFASFTAQKGTCGTVYRQEDMPFDSTGLTPDLLINPHAFPSRMTVNYLLQVCFDRAASLSGIRFDATAFQHSDVETEIDDAAKLAGLTSWDSTLYCGVTGRKFPAKIFTGPCPYQRLRHMVSGKIHSRVSGPVDALTRQPVAGRSRDGGIKVGEMEQWCKISHGAATALRESMFDKSDHYAVPVCRLCGYISDHFQYCRHCDDIAVEPVGLPYTTKLLFQELGAIGIKIRFQP